MRTDLVAESVMLSVDPHSGNGELVSMVTVKDGLGRDSRVVAILVTVLVIARSPSFNAAVGLRVLAS
jgi:hypothetical protein